MPQRKQAVVAAFVCHCNSLVCALWIVRIRTVRMQDWSRLHDVLGVAAVCHVLAVVLMSAALALALALAVKAQRCQKCL
ncbi:hypothetical protein V8F06_009178 [Rhypophila decipiens]